MYYFQNGFSPVAIESKCLMYSFSIFQSDFQFQGNAELREKKKIQKLLFKYVGTPTRERTTGPGGENRILPFTPERALSTFTSRLRKVKRGKKNLYLLVLWHRHPANILDNLIIKDVSLNQ